MEDPLRVYRVARFASELEFEVDEDTLKLMNNLRDELDTLSKERVFVEFQKTLSSNKPSKINSDTLAVISPASTGCASIARLISCSSLVRNT